MRRALISSKAAFTPTTNPHSRHGATPNATVRATFVMTDGARLTPTGRECWIAAWGPLVTWTMTTVTGLGDSAATLLLSPLPSFALRHGLSRRGGCHRPPDEFRVINNFQRQRFLGAGPLDAQRVTFNSDRRGFRHSGTRGWNSLWKILKLKG